MPAINMLEWKDQQEIQVANQLLLLIQVMLFLFYHLCLSVFVFVGGLPLGFGVTSTDAAANAKRVSFFLGFILPSNPILIL
jgi:hypothetical protein